MLSLVVSVTALVVAIFAIRQGNRNSSAATLVALNEGFRQAWQRFLLALSDQDSTRQQYELSELMNMVEIASAIYLEGSLSGVSRELMEAYLDRSLSLLANNPNARKQISAMLDSPATFKYIRMFTKSRPKCSALFMASSSA